MRKIKFTGLIFRESDMYVSYCPELDVSSCGESLEKARQNLLTAVKIFIEETEKMGTLETILEEEGFVPKDVSKQEWLPPELISTEHMQLLL